MMLDEILYFWCKIFVKFRFRTPGGAGVHYNKEHSPSQSPVSQGQDSTESSRQQQQQQLSSTQWLQKSMAQNGSLSNQQLKTTMAQVQNQYLQPDPVQNEYLQPDPESVVESGTLDANHWIN